MENNAFSLSCEQMKNSKYVFVDKNIAEILKSIAKSQEIMDVISNSLTGFVFSKELKIATSLPAIFLIPSDSNKFIALTFCILNAIDDKKIDINQLLAKYFSEKNKDPYQNFCEKIIDRFNYEISNKLNKTVYKTEKNEKLEKIGSEEMSDECASRILFLSEKIKAQIPYKNVLMFNVYECFVDTLKNKNSKISYCLFEVLKKDIKNKKNAGLFNEVDEVFCLVKGGVSI